MTVSQIDFESVETFFGQLFKLAMVSLLGLVGFAMVNKMVEGKEKEDDEEEFSQNLVSPSKASDKTLFKRMKTIFDYLHIPPGMRFDNDAILFGETLWHILTMDTNYKSYFGSDVRYWQPRSLDIYCKNGATKRFREYFYENNFSLITVKEENGTLVEEWCDNLYLNSRDDEKEFRREANDLFRKYNIVLLSWEAKIVTESGQKDRIRLFYDFYPTKVHPKSLLDPYTCGFNGRKFVRPKSIDSGISFSNQSKIDSDELDIWHSRGLNII